MIFAWMRSRIVANKTGPLYILTLVFCLSVHPLTQLSAAIPSDERNALIAFFDATNGTDWSEQSFWLGPPGTEGSWHGVTVEDDHVTRIVLEGNRVQGVIPPEIKNLQHLRELKLGPFLAFVSLYCNSVSSLPEEIGQLQNLEVLDLGCNDLESIPQGVGSLDSLVELILDRNEIRVLPASMSALNQLERVSVFSNRLINFPEQLCELENLREVLLDGNEIASLPPCLGDVKSLETLSVRANTIDLLPRELGSLDNLRVLRIDGNPVGALPSEIVDLSSLEYLSAVETELSELPRADRSTDSATAVLRGWQSALVNPSQRRGTHLLGAAELE